MPRIQSIHKRAGNALIGSVSVRLDEFGVSSEEIDDLTAEHAVNSGGYSVYSGDYVVPESEFDITDRAEIERMQADIQSLRQVNASQSSQLASQQSLIEASNEALKNLASEIAALRAAVSSANISGAQPVDEDPDELAAALDVAPKPTTKRGK